MKFIALASVLLFCVAAASSAGAERILHSDVAVKATTPQLASLNINMFFMNLLTKTVKEDAIILSFEPGLQGHKVFFGYGIWEPGTQFGGKIGVLKTRNDPLWAESDRTYIGLEGEGRFWFYVLSGGLFVSNRGGDQDYIVSLGCGFGLPLR